MHCEGKIYVLQTRALTLQSSARSDRGEHNLLGNILVRTVSNGMDAPTP